MKKTEQYSVGFRKEYGSPVLRMPKELYAQLASRLPSQWTQDMEDGTIEVCI